MGFPPTDIILQCLLISYQITLFNLFAMDKILTGSFGILLELDWGELLKYIKIYILYVFH